MGRLRGGLTEHFKLCLYLELYNSGEAAESDLRRPEFDLR